ncbi:MAG: hypothetical protein HC913_14865 [Microscillaceae bacterium]|nr:hypothetical protein [Microscillaceae bacterium]
MRNVGHGALQQSPGHQDAGGGCFDDRGTLVREIYYNGQEKPGMHHLTYHFDCDEYQDSVYHFKIIRDDQVSMVNTLRRVERD